ncbi:MAG: MerR family transcriptional regulator, thiopeptide resistance regulator [Acidimicrobiaceae bacterium]|nr:MerR family transcriptional regulator, thiopeptide resistance regulator [Acidimicrobiaceae bacterium]
MESLSEDLEVHRRFGAQLFNDTWDLIDKADRRDADDDQMLLAAMASRWHWGQVGTAEQVATGDWQVAHVFGLVGYAAVAVRFARHHLATATAEGWDGWRLASAHEGMARAFAVAGDGSGRAAQMAAAEAALAREPDAEDGDAIAAQLATVPPV